MRVRSLSLLFAFATLGSAGSLIKAGAASVSIAPRQPAWLAGSSGRTHPGESASGDLRARALAIDDGSGGRAVLVSVELLAIPRALTEMIAADLMKELGLERGQILIEFHGNSQRAVCPRAAPGSSHPPAWRSAAESPNTRPDSHRSLVGLATGAFLNMRPVRIGIAFGRASFAVNAPLRAALGASSPAGPIDTIGSRAASRNNRWEDAGCRVRLCLPSRRAGHADSYAVSGDYAGVAADRIERDFPGSVALFLRLCDGGQAPSPRGSASLAQVAWSRAGNGGWTASEVADAAGRRPTARDADRDLARVLASHAGRVGAGIEEHRPRPRTVGKDVCLPPMMPASNCGGCPTRSR
jgi:neutral ceramidase